MDEDDDVSIQSACNRYGKVIADQVTIRLALDDPSYEIVPENPSKAQKLKKFDEINEENTKNGKFGWCIICRG